MNYFYFVLGGFLGIIVGWFLGLPNRKEVDKLKSERKNQHFKILEVASIVTNITNKLNNHDDRVETLENKMDRVFEYFGSMIRHSQEQPYTKEAIAKFLEEHGIREE
jgi:hypothetical protein